MSWSEIALQVDAAACGWSALGVSPGATVWAVGPLSESFVITLLALQTLGARLRAASPVTPVDTWAPARFVLAHGTADVAEFLSQRAVASTGTAGVDLQALVVETSMGEERIEGAVVLDWAALVKPQPPAPALTTPPAAGSDILLTHRPFGAMLVGGAGAGDAGRLSATDTVLAEFETHWQAGLHWLLNDWLSSGAALVLAEPGMQPGACLEEVRPRWWLASAGVLSAFEAAARSRIPSAGVGGGPGWPPTPGQRGIRWRKRCAGGACAGCWGWDQCSTPAATI